MFTDLNEVMASSCSNHEDSLAYEVAIELFGLSEQLIASGMTTCIYAHEIDSMVYGVTVDPIKLKFMKKANLPNFKILCETKEGTLYEMKKLKMLDDASFAEISCKVKKFEAIKSKAKDISISEIQNVFGDSINANALGGLIKNNPNRIFIDITEDQFLLDDENKITCVDPVMDKTIYKRLAS